MVKIARGYKIADGYIEITAETDKGERTIKRFLRDTRGRLHDEQGRYASEGELAGAAFGDKLAKAADRRSQRGLRGMFSRWGHSVLGGAKFLGGLFANKFVAVATAGLGALPTAISAAASALGSALNIAGAGAALAPAAIGGLALTMLSLKTAFSGLGAALKAGVSGNMAAFAKATKDMAPALQDVAKTLVKLNPLIKFLKQSVQQSFWHQFGKDVEPIAMTYLPMIYKTMGNIARAFGAAAHEIAGFFLDPGVVDGMAMAFDDIGTAMGNVAKVLPPVVRMLQTLFQVGASFLPGLTAGFAGVALHLEEMLGHAAETGQLQAFIQAGLDKAKALGTALGNIVGIFRSIGQAASGVAGGGIFGAIGQLLGMLNKFFKSMEGQAVLTNFFARLQALGQLIMGLVGGALPGLLKFSDGMLSALQSLAPIARVVGKAIGDALGALAPILPVLGKILGILLTLASGVLSSLAAALGPLIALWAQLAGGLADRLLPVIQQMISDALPLAIQLGKNLADSFAPLVPIILDIASAFLGGFMQAWPDFLDVLQKLLPVLSGVAQHLGKALLDALVRIQPYIPDLVKAFVLFIKVFAVLVGSYLPKAITMFGWLLVAIITVAGWFVRLLLATREVVHFFADLGATVRGFVSSAGSAIIGWLTSVVGWFTALPGKIWNALVSLVTSIPKLFSDSLDQAGYVIGYAIGTIVRMVMELPGKIKAALTELPAIIWGLFTHGWEMAKNATSAAVSFLGNLGAAMRSRVASAISALPGLISGFFSSAWDKAKSIFSSGVTTVTNTAKSLPGKIKSALSGAAGWLYGVGQDIVRGLANGISSMFGWVYNKARSIASNILKGAKDALGIGSPSKVMAREVGRWIPPGIMQGADKAMPDLDRYMHASMTRLAQRPAQVNVAAPNVSVPPTTVYVLLDSKQIGAQITLDPKRVARSAVEGDRQRNFLNTGRPAGAFG